MECFKFSDRYEPLQGAAQGDCEYYWDKVDKKVVRLCGHAVNVDELPPSVRAAFAGMGIPGAQT